MVFAVDLATVVDKYVGETEKNLDAVFREAAGVQAVLFFDEADALFAKRGQVSDANDRYANLQVAFLLQRLEDFDGLAVLATNLASNLDEAVSRRVDVVVQFDEPDADARRRLWALSLGAAPLHEDVDLGMLASCYLLAGGDIRNAAVAAAHASARDGFVTQLRLVEAVEDEYRKLGRLAPVGSTVRSPRPA